MIVAAIGAHANHPPDQKQTFINDIKLGFQVITGTAPGIAQPSPVATTQPTPVPIASRDLPPPEQTVVGPCTGLDPQRLKVETVTVDGIAGAQKSYSVDLTLRNVSKQIVSLMYVDPVQLTDDQGNHIPLRTGWLKPSQPTTNEVFARGILTAGLKIDSSIPTPINLNFGPIDQIGKTVSVSIPLVEGAESNGKDIVLLLRLECRGLAVQ